MANPYVNKVETANGTTIIDITDTTAEAVDVKAGKYFYTKSGARTLGSASSGNYVIGYDENTAVGTALVGTATTTVPNYTPSGDIEYTVSPILVPVSAQVLFNYNGACLNMYGIEFYSESVDVVTSVDGFKGSGVKFIIEEESE